MCAVANQDKIRRSPLSCSCYVHKRVDVGLWTLSIYLTINMFVEKKCQLAAKEVFIADLITCSICFGQLYAHH